MELDADKRISAEQALAHPYLAVYADPTDEPSSSQYDQTFEDLDLPVEQWKGISHHLATGPSYSFNNPSHPSFTWMFCIYFSEYVWNEVQRFQPPQ